MLFIAAGCFDMQTCYDCLHFSQSGSYWANDGCAWCDSYKVHPPFFSPLFLFNTFLFSFYTIYLSTSHLRIIFSLFIAWSLSRSTSISICLFFFFRLFLSFISFCFSFSPISISFPFSFYSCLRSFSSLLLLKKSEMWLFSVAFVQRMKKVNVTFDFLSDLFFTFTFFFLFPQICFDSISRLLSRSPFSICPSLFLSLSLFFFFFPLC